MHQLDCQTGGALQTSPIDNVYPRGFYIITWTFSLFFFDLCGVFFFKWSEPHGPDRVESACSNQSHDSVF